MGTRADFYQETPEGLKWLASIAWDGYPDGVKIVTSQDKHTTTYNYLTDCSSEIQYLHFLKEFLADRDDVTYPDQGWPWPWENSRTTDYAYIFSNERKEVLIANFGRGWFNQKEYDAKDQLTPEEWETLPKVDFPDMTDIMNVAWDNRSGLMIFEEKK